MNINEMLMVKTLIVLYCANTIAELYSFGKTFNLLSWVSCEYCQTLRIAKFAEATM